jgi:O-antigen/teichoic acid export membrane protein
MNKTSISRIGRNSAIYGIGNMLSLAAGFILIPLYTHALTPGEYGVLELLNKSSDVLMLVVVLGLRQAYLRFYYEKKEDVEWHKTVTSTTCIFLLCSALFVDAVAFPLRGVFARMLFDDRSLGRLFVYTLAWIPAEIITQLGFAYLQIRMKAAVFVSLAMSRLVCVIGSNMLLVYRLEMGVEGILITNVCVTMMTAVGFLIYFASWAGLRFDTRVLKNLVTFGFPYLPASIFSFVISSADRYFLTRYASLDAVGIYALGYKIGMFGTSILLSPFSRVWSPFLFQNYNEPHGPRAISRVFILFALAGTTLAIGISVLSPIVIPLISDQAYHEAYRAVPFICFAAALYSLACIADAGILISKKTYFKPLIAGSAAVLAVALNFALVPRFGMIGAAASLALTYLGFFIINFTIANRYYRIDIQPKKLALLFGSFIATYLVFERLFERFGGSPAGTMSCAGALLLFPLLVAAGGFFDKNDLLIVRKLINR